MKNNYLTSLPPKPEFIETTISKFHAVIFLKEQEIEKLKESEVSLINKVVRGKVKVGFKK